MFSVFSSIKPNTVPACWLLAQQADRKKKRKRIFRNIIGTCLEAQRLQLAAVYLYIVFHIAPYLGEISLHGSTVLAVYDVEQLMQLLANMCHLVVRIRVEEYLLQQVIVFVEHSA